MKKIVKFGLIPLVLIIVGIVIYKYPRLNIITGFSAKSVCSCTFEAGRDLASIEAGDNDISPIYYAKNVINREEKSVTATVFGLKKRTAIYREGVGCVLLPKGYEDQKFKPSRTFVKNELPYPYGDVPQKDTLFSNIDYSKLQNAVENAFDSENEELKRTRAVVVIYKNQIITEKYGEGFSKNTKLLGWSMTKSITSAVLGVLEKQGKINANQTNLFPEWENDEDYAIELLEKIVKPKLLRMVEIVFKDDIDKLIKITFISPL